MKEIKVENLPDGVYFWRKGYSFMWLKVSDSEVVNFEIPTSIFEIDFNDEIVLSEPHVCEVCWEGLPGFPPVKKCPNCCVENEDRDSLISIKKRISDWSGNPNPHI